MLDFKKLRSQVADGKTFSTTIPSLGIEVMGKIYDLNDEVTLAGLLELDDVKFFYAGLANLIANKYSLSPDIMDKLTAIDIQHLTTQLKKHSDGNIVKITFKCPHDGCDSKLNTEVNIDEIKLINKENFKKIYTLSDTLKMEVGLPSYEDFYSILEEFKDIKETDAAKMTAKNIELFKYSIKCFYTGDDVDVVDHETRMSEKFHEYVTTDLRPQYFLFQHYLNEEIPELKYDKKIICANCKKEINLDVDDFFYSML